jgi:hypothetical protein
MNNASSQPAARRSRRWMTTLEGYRALELVQRGGGLDAFEQLIGPVDAVQTEWHAYVHRLKAALGGKDLELFKSRKRSTPPTRLPKPNETPP